MTQIEKQIKKNEQELKALQIIAKLYPIICIIVSIAISIIIK